MYGPELLKIYDRIEKHPRGQLAQTSVTVHELIEKADMVVSFPFTSPTFEALSSNIPAVWYDPLGLYEKTVYGRVPQASLCEYSNLKKMLETIYEDPCSWHNPFPQNSPLMDPYRDSGAIDRFRDLLIQYTTTPSE